MMRFAFKLLGSVLISTALFSLPALAADTNQDTTSAQAENSPKQQYSDKQLKQFAQAQEGVQEAMQKWQTKLQDADENDKAKLEQKRNEDMTQAVEDSGLDAKTYNEIAQQAQKDDKLTRRIQSYMTPQ